MTELSIPGTFTETSLDLPPDLSFEQWSDAGLTLKRIDGAVKWWIGDWLNYGEERFPEKWSQAVEATEYSQETLRKAAWVAGRVPRNTRRETLSYRHHELIASLPPEEQEEWLDEAEPEDFGMPPRLTTRELRRAVKDEEEKGAEVVETMDCPACEGSGKVPIEEASGVRE